MQLLHIDSSILGAGSVSRHLSREIVAAWQAAHPGTHVEHLDLAVSSPGHLSSESLGFRFPPGGTLTEAQVRENAVSEALVSQFLAADVVVVGAPLYNFTIPTQLKAWIDRVAQAGRTFRYTEQGPQGLAGGKTVILGLSRGGIYSTSEGGQAAEHQESLLKVVFGFFGITDIRVVRAEGIGLGEAAKAKALESAQAEIAQAVGAAAANQADVALAA